MSLTIVQLLTVVNDMKLVTTYGSVVWGMGKDCHERDEKGVVSEVWGVSGGEEG